MRAVYVGRRRTAPAWPRLAGAAPVVAAALLAGVWAATHRSTARGAGAAHATAGLLVHGHNQPVAATLTGGIHARGTLYPALPGANVVDLTLDLAGAPGAGVGTLRIRALMPGMAMAPALATLRGQDGHYRGTIILPMFGEYVARVALVTARGQRQGTLDLPVPLTLSR